MMREVILLFFYDLQQKEKVWQNDGSYFALKRIHDTLNSVTYSLLSEQSRRTPCPGCDSK
jgi:hypothetical protein